MVTPVARREAVAHLCGRYEVSQRRACGTIGTDRSSMRYRGRRPDDGAVRARLRELAASRRRFGYRRLQILLQREGTHMNHKRLRRLYAEERLQVRRRGGRKRALGTRAPMTIPQGPNQRWSLDFVSDALGDGRRFRILAVVDDYSRECLCLVADTSLSGMRVARELDLVIARRGRPAGIVSDNGTELTSMAILRWSQETRVEWHYIAPGPFDRLRVRADPERLHRELQRPAARRAVERDAVHIARPCPDGSRCLEGRLQHHQAAQCDRQRTAGDLRQTRRSRDATGRGAALARGLRAPSRCTTGPDGLK